MTRAEFFAKLKNPKTKTLVFVVYPLTLAFAGGSIACVATGYAGAWSYFLYGGAAVMLALFLLSFAVEARFAAEERSVALAYLPVLVFNGFCLVLSFTLALSN